MNKQTILYAGGFKLPDKNAAAHRAMNNAKLFRKLGYDVIFSGVSDSPSDISYVFNDFVCFDRNYPKNIFQWLKYIFIVSPLIKLIEVENISCLILYNFQAPALYRLLKYCRKKGITVLADITEWYGVSHLPLPQKIMKGLDVFFRMRFLHFRLDGLIVISKYLETYYKKGNLPIILVPPLIDFKDEIWSGENDIDRSSRIKFIYSGTPGADKDNLSIFINALYSLRKEQEAFTLSIVGMSFSEYCKEYPVPTELMNFVRSSVKFIGRVSHKESISQIKKADFSIIIREKNRITTAGFPTKFVESISAGTPVIATATSDIANYLDGNNIGYLLDISSNQSIINSMINIFTMKRSQINSLKENCRKSSLFHYEKYEDEFELFFNTIDKK